MNFFRPPLAALRTRSLQVFLFAALLVVAVLLARAEGVELQQLSTQRAEDGGLNLSYSTRFELPPSADEALLKGVPIYFTVEAQVLRNRWYWRDARLNKASRTYRLTYQTLTRQYKVSTGGLNQSYNSLGEALALIRDTAGWRIAEAKELEDSGSYYLEFSFRLDTSQLPRPMQIGLGAPRGWDLSIERTVQLNPDFSIRAVN